MSIRWKSLAFGFVAFAGGSFASSSARADEEVSRSPRCTNAALRGQYAFSARGNTLPNGPLPSPLFGAFASGGTSVFDGQGHFTLTATSSFNGAVQGPVVVGGTYDVNPDCTYTSRADNGVTFSAVITNDARTLSILQTTPATAIVGTAERLDMIRRDGPRGLESSSRDAGIRACPVDLSRRAYGFIAEGMAGAPTVPNAPFGPLVGVGTLKFDGAGRFAVLAQRSVNGAIDPKWVPLEGGYALARDCSLELKFDVGFNFRGGIAAQGDAIRLVETDPGTALVVRAAAM